MSFQNVRAALVAAYVEAFAPSDPPRTAYENDHFNLDDLPESICVWNKVSIISSDADPVTLGEEGEDRYQGILQVDVNARTGTGTKDIHTVLTTLRNYFPAGKGFSYSGDTAIVKAFSITPGRVVDGFYRITAEIEFRADMTRPTIT